MELNFVKPKRLQPNGINAYRMLNFVKYQGTGNDFILLDNRSGVYNNLNIAQIQHLCNRKFGIGADGLIKLNAHPELDFEVDYYNADGSKSFCGNGARCSVQFASDLGIDVSATKFLAIDGIHRAWKKGDQIELEMLDVDSTSRDKEAYIIHTGSPHYVVFVENIASFDIVEYGKSIRYNDVYRQEGINVNAVGLVSEKSFEIKTYERGVEDETLSCGTGVTAAALAFAIRYNLTGELLISAKTQGGECQVSFNRVEDSFTSVRLIGPADFVFKGQIDEHV